MPDQSFPAKGINLLEEAALFAQSQSMHTVSKEILRSIISQKNSNSYRQSY